MDSSNKVFVAGHKGLVGSAIVRYLKKNLIKIFIGLEKKIVI